MEEEGGSNIRVWRVKKDSPGGITISPDSVVVQGDKNSFIAVQPGSINLSSNKVIFQTQPENISKGAVFKENYAFFQMIPSTTVTPMANLIPNIPGAGLVQNLIKGSPAIAFMNVAVS